MYRKLFALGLLAAFVLAPTVAQAQWSFPKRDFYVEYDALLEEVNYATATHHVYYGLSTGNWGPVDIQLEFRAETTDGENNWWLLLDTDEIEGLNVWGTGVASFEGEDLLLEIGEGEHFTGSFKIVAYVYPQNDPFELADTLVSYFDASYGPPTTTNVSLVPGTQTRSTATLEAHWHYENDSSGVFQNCTLEIQQWDGSAWTEIDERTLGNPDFPSEGQVRFTIDCFQNQGGSFRYRTVWNDGTLHQSGWTTFSAPDPGI